MKIHITKRNSGLIEYLCGDLFDPKDSWISPFKSYESIINYDNRLCLKCLRINAQNNICILKTFIKGLSR